MAKDSSTLTRRRPDGEKSKRSIRLLTLPLFLDWFADRFYDRIFANSIREITKCKSPSNLPKLFSEASLDVFLLYDLKAFSISGTEELLYRGPIMGAPGRSGRFSHRKEAFAAS